MLDISAALVVTSNEASKRMEVDYVEFNVDATTGYSFSEQFILFVCLFLGYRPSPRPFA